MKYLGGRAIRKDDLCWHAERRQIARVAKVIESPKGKEKYGVSEAGVFLCEDLSLEEPELDLFIGEQYFAEEEIDALTKEEQTLLSRLKHLALDKVKQSFGEDVSYSIRCIENPVENRPPHEREWVIKFYGSQNLWDEEYLVCDDFSRLRKLGRN